MQISREKIRKIAIYLLLILIVLRFLFVPQYREYSEKKELLSKKSKDYETALILSRDKILPSNHDLINKVFSTEEISYVQSLLLSYSEKLCSKHNLVLTHYDLLESSSEGTVREVNVSLNLEGKPSQILSFLSDLKRYPKFLDIKTFEASESQNRYLFKIVITTYKAEK